VQDKGLIQLEAKADDPRSGFWSPTRAGIYVNVLANPAGQISLEDVFEIGGRAD
jgi:hypothetical protein